MNSKGMEQLGTGYTQVSVSKAVAVSAMVMLLLIPELAFAQDMASGAFGGITSFLKSITQLLIYEWGYYIGIITLGIQAYRLKAGRIDWTTMGVWALGIFTLFFAPNIVSAIRAGSQGNIG
ncbi:TrbC/VirB2 family protein [Xanthomonas albilineans]|uniref:TrbC/VirB2 family protein n=1 Tax=Xanthomonas albilineans TaxID=29447 RepID=UPI0006961CD0